MDVAWPIYCHTETFVQSWGFQWICPNPAALLSTNNPVRWICQTNSFPPVSPTKFAALRGMWRLTVGFLGDEPTRGGTGLSQLELVIPPFGFAFGFAPMLREQLPWDPIFAKGKAGPNGAYCKTMRNAVTMSISIYPATTARLRQPHPTIQLPISPKQRPKPITKIPTNLSKNDQTQHFSESS